MTLAQHRAISAVPTALIVAALACDSEESAGVLDASDAQDASLVDNAILDRIVPGDEITECESGGFECSADLHQVTCQGTVVKTCPVDQGCFMGECIDACMASGKARTAVGCDFYATVPAMRPGLAGQCYAVAVVNDWGDDVGVTVEYQGSLLDVSRLARIPVGSATSATYTPLPATGRIPSGTAALLFLASKGPHVGYKCPLGTEPAITDRYVEVEGTLVTDAFHIVTDRPVRMYDFYPYASGKVGTGAVSLLLPTTMWTTNYIAQTPYHRSVTYLPTNSLFVQLTAMSDHTTIELQPPVDLIGNSALGIPSCDAGNVQVYTLNKGQVLQFVQSEELVGTVIAGVDGGAPFGVWGGATHFGIEVDQSTVDSAHQQVLPISVLGNEYAAVPHRRRHPEEEEKVPPPWRIVGVVDGTRLVYYPARPAAAPESIDKGTVVTFKFTQQETPFPFVVRSQDPDHPFYFWSYMTSGSNFTRFYGDAEWTFVPPSAQFVNSCLFFTDPTYPETDLLIIRKKYGGTFHDVLLDCAGPLSGWTKLSDDLEFVLTTLVTGDFAPQGNCNNGMRRLSSAGPFGVTVWGWGTGSYGSTSYAVTPCIQGTPANNAVAPVIK